MKKEHGDDGPMASDPITALTITFPDERVLVQEEDGGGGVAQEKSSEMKSQEERIKEWRGAGFKNGVAVTF
jgi:hypothetical protein